MTHENLIQKSTKEDRLCHAHIISEAEELNKNTNTSYFRILADGKYLCGILRNNCLLWKRHDALPYSKSGYREFNCIRLHRITVTDNYSFLPRKATTLVKLIKLDNDRLYPS